MAKKAKRARATIRKPKRFGLRSRRPAPGSNRTGLTKGSGPIFSPLTSPTETALAGWAERTRTHESVHEPCI